MGQKEKEEPRIMPWFSVWATRWLGALLTGLKNPIWQGNRMIREMQL